MWVKFSWEFQDAQNTQNCLGGEEITVLLTRPPQLGGHGSSVGATGACCHCRAVSSGVRGAPTTKMSTP